MLDNLEPLLDLPGTQATPSAAPCPVDAALRLAMQVCGAPLLAVDPHQLQVVEFNGPAGLMFHLDSGATAIALNQLLGCDADLDQLASLRARMFGLEAAQSAQFHLEWRIGESSRVCQTLAWPYVTPQNRSLVLLRIEDALAISVSRLQQAADSQAANYYTLIEGMLDGFIRLDDAGRILHTNATAEQLLRERSSRLVGHRLQDLFPTLSSGDLSSLLTQGEDGQPNKLVVPVMLREEPHQFEFKAHTQPDGIGVVFRDVSAEMRQELEIANLKATMAAGQELLRRQNEQLNHAVEQQARLNEQLTKADQLKGEFLSNTSHELRTPLNAIIGFLQLIDEDLCEDEAERTQYTKNALTAARSLLTLINDLLDITKIEAGKMNFLIENQDIEEIFQETYSLTKVLAQQKNLAIDFELRNAPKLMVRADAHKTVQILVNLVGNSIKFTDEGGIEVWAEPEPESTDHVRITVRDTGIGVAVSQQKQIFEKFMQGDGSATRRHQGTGLGLAITKNLVEMMGGTIDLHSPGDGEGTTVWFTLPRACELAHSAPEEISEEIMEEWLPDTF